MVPSCRDMEGVMATTMRSRYLKLISSTIVWIIYTITSSRPIVGVRILAVVIPVLAWMPCIIRVVDKIWSDTTSSKQCQTTHKQKRKNTPNKTFVVHLLNGFKIDSVHHDFIIGVWNHFSNGGFPHLRKTPMPNFGVPIRFFDKGLKYYVTKRP